MNHDLKEGDIVMTPQGVKTLSKDYDHNTDFYIYIKEGTKYSSFNVQYQITPEKHPEYFL